MLTPTSQQLKCVLMMWSIKQAFSMYEICAAKLFARGTLCDLQKQALVLTKKKSFFFQSTQTY